MKLRSAESLYVSNFTISDSSSANFIYKSFARAWEPKNKSSVRERILFGVDLTVAGLPTILN